MVYSVSHFINGKVIQGQSQQTLPIFHPATGAKQGIVTLATSDETLSAINAARQAYEVWSTKSINHRTDLFFRFRDLLNTHLKKLAETICNEHGKTFQDAIGELKRGMEVVELACHAGHYLKGDYSKEVSQHVDTYSVHQPLGVCVGITPFNFPAMIGLWMFPISLVCGNTFIWKPSEKDPSVSILLAELMQEAGFPDGVLNVIQGEKPTVDTLITHPDVKAVSFVGSTPIAQMIYQKAALHHKRVQCGGSAKNIAIIMPDADLDYAAHAITGAAFGSAGERCMAISAVFTLGDPIREQLIQKLKPLIETIRIGDGLSADIDVGPLITNAHYERVTSYLELGLAEGAQLIVDGRNHPARKQPGFFLGPSLFTQVTPTMRIYQEEIFGPVLSLLQPPDLATAIRWVNEHPYGNGTAIFTQDGFAAHTFAMGVQVGMVGINMPIPVPVGYHTFGGWKQSFFGDIGMYGSEGFRFYTKIKTITERWLEGNLRAEFTI